MNTTGPVIDFNDYLGGEEALKSAAAAVRALKTEVLALNKSIQEDGKRNAADLAAIKQAAAGLKDSAPTGRLLMVGSEAEIKQVDALRAQIAELRAAKTALQKEDEGRKATQKVLIDASKAATTALKEQQAAFRAAASSGDAEGQKKAALAILEIKAGADQASRAVRGAASEFTAATGSINDLRLQLSKGTAAYNALSDAERDNSEAGKKLRDSNKAISDQLKVLEKGIGDHRREVGNYGLAFKEASANGLLPFSNQINRVVQVSDQLRGGLQAARQGLFGVREGGVAAGEGLNIVKVGIASTGIGLLLVALVSLYEYFTKTDDGAEDLAAGLAYLKGAFSVLEGAVVTVGRGLALVFKDPKQAATDFIKLLETNLANRVKAVGVIFQSIGRGSFGGAVDGALQLATGVENVRGKAKGLVDEMGRASDVARQLARDEDELENLEIKAIARNEKDSQLAAKLLLTAKDRNLTEAQRLTNLNKAGQLETGVLKRNLEIENERLRIITATNKEAVKRLGKDGIADADRRKEQDQIAKIAQLQGNYEQQQQVIANRRSVLQKGERAEALAKAKAAHEQELERQREAVRERQIQIRRELLAVKEGSAEELELKKRDLQAGRDLALINDQLSKNARQLIREQERVDERKADDEFAARKAEAEKKDLEERRRKAVEVQGIVEKAYQTELAAIQNSLKAQQGALDAALARGEISRAEHDAQLLAAKRAALNEEKALDEKFDKDKADAQKRSGELELAEARRVADKRKAIIEKVGGYLQQAADYFSQYRTNQLSNESDAEQKRYEQSLANAGQNTKLREAVEKQHQQQLAKLEYKRAVQDQQNAAFQVELQTAVAIAKSFAESPETFGLPFSAVAAVQGAIQLALIYSRKVPVPQFFLGRRGGEAVPLATVAERGPEIIERANAPQGKRFEFVSEMQYTSLGRGDSVYTASETASILARAGSDMEAMRQPMRVSHALNRATENIQQSRLDVIGAGRAGELSGIRDALNKQTAVLSKLKQVTVNVIGEQVGAEVKQGGNLTRYYNQRMQNFGG